MNNSQISNRLRRLADMLTLLKEEPQKGAAFENGANIIQNYPEEMGVLIDENRLKNVEGIEDNLAQVILYYAKSGNTALEQELEARLPLGLPALLDLDGLGVREVQTLWEEHHVSDLGTLEQVCHAGLLAKWDGFDQKLTKKLLISMENNSQYSEDFLLDIATHVGKTWLEKLSVLPGVERVEVTGKLRRGYDLIQSVDFIMLADPKTLKESLLSHYKQEVIGADPLTFSDSSGLPINLWLATPGHFATRQLVLTGGDRYLDMVEAALREKQISHDRGRVIGSKKIYESEEQLCESLDIQWIDPVLRDNYNRFHHDSLLVQNEDIKGVLHVHSSWSDGKNSLRQMLEHCQRLGYQYLGISDHSQAAYYANGLKPERVLEQWEHINELNEQFPDMHIFKGIEADILKDGSLDYDAALLQGFDFVIASIHSHFHLDPTQQTDRIIRALQNPFTTMLGHPTGRMLLAREGYGPDLPAIIDAACEYGKIIEINSTPKRLDIDWRSLRLVHEKGVNISINPDAHGLKGLETVFLGVMMAQKGGLGPNNVINTMDMKELTIFFERLKLTCGNH